MLFWLFCLIPVRLFLAHQAKVLPGGHCGGALKLIAIMGFLKTYLVGFVLCFINRDAPRRFIIPMVAIEILSLVTILALA